MNIYKISQTVNNDYDTYDSAVVVAESAKQAASMHPAGPEWVGCGTWASRDKVTVELIGKYIYSEDTEPFVVVASFNAG